MKLSADGAVLLEVAAEDIDENGSFTFPPEVTAIGDDAFNFCALLKKISIPKRITSIGQQAFGGCRNLQEVNIESVTSIAEWARGIAIAEWAFLSCENLQRVNLPTKIKIHETTFNTCEKLQQISINSEDEDVRKRIIVQLPIELQDKVVPYSVVQPTHQAEELHEKKPVSNYYFYLNALSTTAVLGGLALGITAIVIASVFMATAAAVCGTVAIGTFFYGSWAKSKEVQNIATPSISIEQLGQSSKFA